MLSIFISGFIPIAISSRVLAVKKKNACYSLPNDSAYSLLLPGLSFNRSIYYMLMGQETIAISFAKNPFDSFYNCYIYRNCKTYKTTTNPQKTLINNITL